LPTPAATSTPSAAPSQGGIPVAQRAALLIQAPDDPQGVKTYVGTVVWRLEPDAGTGLSSVVASLDIPDANFAATIKISKNMDSKLPATHTMEIRLSPQPDSPITGVKDIGVPQMRNEDKPVGDVLAATPARITDSLFLIWLSQGDSAAPHNLDLLTTRGWFDVPILLSNDKIAKLTFEKGPSGDRILAEAIAAWAK
jgi:hypothetical protein